MGKIIIWRYFVIILALMVLLGCASTIHSPEKETNEILVLDKTDNIFIERVFFPSVPETEINIPATFYRPSSITQGALSAVILMHGAFGLEGYEYHYAKKFCDLGFFVLLPDFFRARKITHMSIAAGLDRKRLGDYTSKMVTDIIGAIKYFKNMGIKASEIVLFGWSVGGTNALRVALLHEEGLGAAIAYYPGCTTRLFSMTPKNKTPLLLIQAEYDDWPDAKKQDCIPRCEALQKLNYPIEYYIVRGAHHCFDNPKAPAIPISKYGCTLEYNPRATAEAWKISMNFLEQHFKSKRSG